MDEASKNVIDSLLIGKYLAGEASPDEVILLEDWISMSATNRLLFEQYISTWNGVEPGKSYQSPDKNGDWRRLEAKIFQSAKPSGKPITFLRGYSVAAVIAGIAILSIIPVIYFLQTGKKETTKNLTITTAGQIKQSSFPDGSSIILNRNSSIQFAQKFAKEQRMAILHGEAYFNIVPDPLRPFVISLEDVNITVLGTSFNVRRNAGDNTIETQVNSGKVRMFNGSGELIVAAGETGVYRKAQNSFTLQKKVDINSTSYATRNFLFSDESLATIIHYLEKAYSKKIILRNAALGRCRMSSSFNNKSIEYVLDVIATTLNISYKMDGDSIFIEGGEHEGC